MTFNYDLAVDYALSFNKFEVDYCLNADRPNHPADISLLKLHGSVNWARCSHCEAISPLPVMDLFRERFSELSSDASFQKFSKVTVPIGARLSNLSHCGRACQLEALIVPPTWNKERHYAQIRRVWRRAAAELREAENVFVIGYSWPETDYFFHHLYALGTVGPSLLRRFWLVDDSAQANERYKRLLGEQSLQRFHWTNCKHENMFGEFIKEFEITDFDNN
jgi:hypothetical protein